MGEAEAGVIARLAQHNAASRIEPLQVLETGFDERGTDAAPLPVGQHGQRPRPYQPHSPPSMVTGEKAM